MKDFFDATWKICVLVLLLLILVAIETNAAESRCSGTIIEYTSADNLTARVDSVIGVCDTVRCYYYNPDCPEDTVWFNKRPGKYTWLQLPNCDVSPWYDSVYVSDWQYTPKTITCRKLICVLKYSEPDSQRRWKNVLVKDPKGELEINGIKYSIVNYTLIPGQAIVWWEEIKP